MRRRTLLAAVAGSGCVGLAGCSRVPGDGSGAVPVAEAFDGAPTRPECAVESETIEVEIGGETREYETAATIPYPDPPSGSTADDVVDYVTAFEEAYITHDVLCDRSDSTQILTIGYSTDRTESFERGERAWLVFCRYAGGASAGVDGGGMWQADLGYSQVSYAVDETGAARVAFEEPRDPSRDEIRADGPDPVADGEFVARFE